MESTADAATQQGPPGRGPSGRQRADRSGLWIGCAALGVLAAFGGYLWTLSAPAPPDFGDAAHVLPVAVEVPAFTLVDHRGEDFDRSRLSGHWSLLFFGYTWCPDVCPMTLQSLTRVRELLDAPAEPAASTQMVFVSVDPARDTPERLAEYVAFFHPDLVGATGDPEQISRLSGAVGAYHRRAEAAEGEAYLVDHASSLFLVDPQARLHAVLHEPEEPRAFVELLRKVQAFERSS